MKGKAIIPLLLGLGVGGACVKLAVDTIRKAQAANKSASIIKAVRARTDIDAQEQITAEMVELVETSENLFAPAADRIETLELAIGRVTAKAIPERSVVLKSMLAPEGTRPGLVGKIPPGFRAVSVKIDEVTGVAFQIKPGDWVDVIVVMDLPSNVRGRKETIAEVILQHVQVAAIGYDTSAQPAGSTSKVKPAKSATVFVLDEDVPKLHLAATRGKITLAMRGDDDVITDRGASATMDQLLDKLRGASGDAPKDDSSHLLRLLDPEPEVEPPHAVLVVHGSTVAKVQPLVERITFETKRSPNIVDVSLGLPSRAAATLRRAPSKLGRPTTSPMGSGGEGSGFDSEMPGDGSGPDDEVDEQTSAPEEGV